MKFSQLFTYTILLVLFSLPSYAVNSTVKPVEKVVNETPVHPIEKEWDDLNRKEKRAKKKEIRKGLKSALKDAKKSKKAASETDVLLIIIAILIPPLAMALYDGITNRFWVSLLLTLLFFIPGMIYTLYIILSGL